MLSSLVNPGLNPSPHVHQVVGGNAFGASMPTDDISVHSTCTTCSFSQDFSNYWKQTCTSRLAMGHISACRRSPTRLLVATMAAARSTTSRLALSKQLLLSRGSAC
ncbi:hypothetical protein F5Y17DRAFT_452475 [Xylariaceae sp. FL0594]|nr:hypothetical protein F5Y17DRAFT_452475 [Xylariaceae sp. FL0594]